MSDIMEITDEILYMLNDVPMENGRYFISEDMNPILREVCEKTNAARDEREKIFLERRRLKAILMRKNKMKEYNEEVLSISKEVNGHYRKLNKFVMDDTYEMCKTDPILLESIRNTNDNSYLVLDNEVFNVEKNNKTTNIIVSKKRTFAAAESYKGKKVAVLNFANNHSIGGAPWSAGAQEESLCRISTLYSCLKKFNMSFYGRHKDMFSNRQIDEMGNSDLIYLPNVTVFKTDESIPLQMDIDNWFNVNVITSAAPELGYQYDLKSYRELIYKRLEKVIQVAKMENVEVLILGAYGCGAFHNPPEVVATVFKILLKQYHFETVEFAVYCNEDSKFSNYQIFKTIFEEE
ncbi:MAG: TIGR02452 family protein [Anaeroplasma sp.]|nr:TIGR02452 family protein [Anaeroplasma sp.]